MRHVPEILIRFRAAAAVAIACLALAGGPTWAILALMWLGLVSDILDGVVARAVGADTDTLRRFDSMVDLLFWLGVLFAALWLHRSALLPWLPWVAGLLVAEGVILAASLYRFGRPAATHAWSAKLWGLLLLAAFTEIFLAGEGGGWMVAILVSGYAAFLDVLAIVLIMPSWRRDVPSAWHAWRFRKNARKAL